MIDSTVQYYTRRRRNPQVSTIKVWYTDTAATLERQMGVADYIQGIITEFEKRLRNDFMLPRRLTWRDIEDIEVFLVMDNFARRDITWSNTIEMTLRVDTFLQMYEQATQSETDINVFATEWHLTIPSTYYEQGRGGFVETNYKNRSCAITHSEHSDEQGPINCMAFALSYRMKKPSYHNEQRATTLAKIKKDARELQTRLNWSVATHRNQIQDFVNLYPDYRVTVLNRSAIISDYSSYTYTGTNYIHDETKMNTVETKAIYLSLKDEHWYAVKSPAEYFRLEGKLQQFFCHKCLVKHPQCFKHICGTPIHQQFKKSRATKSCDKCGKLYSNKNCPCSETNCSTCKIAYSSGLQHKRCLATKRADIPKSQQQFDTDQSKTYSALWAYDLESSMLEDETHLEQYDIVNGIHVRSHKIFRHVPNLAIAKNVMTGEMKEWYGESCITEMVTFMMDYNCGNNILVAHNASGYDSRLVYEAIAKCIPGVHITCINRGSKILNMNCYQIKQRNSKAKLIFKDSILHLPGSLANLAKAFCKGRMLKGYFPHLFNTTQNQNYIGPIPAKHFFDMERSARFESDLQAFNEWYATQTGDWNFKEELIKYCRNDVEMLADIIKQYDDTYYETFEAHPFYYTTTPSLMQDVSLRQQRKQMNIDRESFATDQEQIDEINRLAQDEEWAALVHTEQTFARECLRGGKTEIRRVYYSLSDEEKARGCKIVLQDICSQYPYQQVIHEFPVGVPHVMVWDYPADYNSKINVQYMNDQPTWDDMKQWRGFICCDIEPPTHLFHATLIENDTDRNKAISSLEFKQRKHFVFDEVKIAVERDGYKVTKVYRFDKYNYRTSKWTDLVLSCYLNKMKYSKNTPSPEECDRLVREYEERFDFGEQVRASFPWTKNDAKKLVFKIGTNSIWGKNAENTIRDNPGMAIDCEEDFDSMHVIFENIQKGLCEFKSLNQVGHLHHIVTAEYVTSARMYHTGYLPAAVCVPSYGRMQLNAELVKLGDRVLMHDTDSIMYVYDPDQYNIPVDDILGGWEIENDQILEFVGVAPKTYAYKCSDGSTKVKCKGVSLTNFHKELVNFDSMKQLVRKYLAVKQIDTIQVPQQSFVYKLGEGIHTHKFMKQLRFNPKELKGVLDRRTGIIYPFGHDYVHNINVFENQTI